MKESRLGDFGLVIAFLVPGFLGFWGLAQYSPTIRRWFGIAGQSKADVGGFLFVLLSSLALGVFLSGVRWAIVDSFFAFIGKRWKNTKLKRPDWDEGSLREEERRVAFDMIVRDYYRFYQFYANTFVGLAVAYTSYHFAVPGRPILRPIGVFVLFLVGEFFLLVSAGDSLRKYHRAGEKILA
jgi:hypothetical protein